MEGKELYNEDEEFNPKSNKGIGDDDADDFGLPEIEDTYGQSDDIGDPFTDKLKDQASDSSFSDFGDSGSYSSDAPYSEPDYSFEEEPDKTGGSDEDEYRSSYYDEGYERKKSPVGMIIFGVLLIVVLGAGIYWWFFLRDKEPEPEPETTILAPVIETTPEPEPIIEEPEAEPAKQAGVYEINAPTGRYHVIVASSIDVDLVRDYANKLAKDGMVCNILAPSGKYKFHRLSVADFEMLNDAAIKSEDLKNSLGDDVWVIRY